MREVTSRALQTIALPFQKRALYHGFIFSFKVGGSNYFRIV
jgi:hypothetical protein